MVPDTFSALAANPGNRLKAVPPAPIASVDLRKDLRVVSLFDGSLQGITRTDKRAFGFQGHPEASPGPQDCSYLFDRFINEMLQRG